MSNTQIANMLTIGGVSLALVIANLPLSPSLGILAFTGIDSCYFTECQFHREYRKSSITNIKEEYNYIIVKNIKGEE